MPESELREPKLHGLEIARLASFTRQLGSMLEVNVSALRALRVAGEQTGDPPFLEAVRDVSLQLEDGKELHQALARHPDYFDPFYVEMVRQGEADGLLGRALLVVAEYLEHQPLGEPGELSSTPAEVVFPFPSGSAEPGHAGIWPILLEGGSAIAAGTAVVQLVKWVVPAIPYDGVDPTLALWWATCLAVTARRLRRSVSSTSVHSPSLVSLPRSAPTSRWPGKSLERRRAESEGVVRATVLEDQPLPPAEDDPAVPRLVQHDESPRIGL